LKTPYSEIRLLATVPWNTFDNTPSGTLHSLLTASVGKEDVFIFAGPLPKEFKQAYPQKEISLTAGIGTNHTSGSDFTFGEQVKNGWNNSIQSEYHRRNESRGRQYPPFG
jgi:hypothetical protein